MWRKIRPGCDFIFTLLGNCSMRMRLLQELPNEAESAPESYHGTFN